MISIRKEEKTDHDAVRETIVAAFTQSEYGHHGEAKLVDGLRAACEDSLSLVAIDSAAGIVGHVFFSPAEIRTPDAKLHGFGLAPLAVRPEQWGRRIGSELVRAGLDELTALGHRFVVVIGEPNYYSRLGFQAALPFCLSHGFDGIPKDLLLVDWLQHSPTVQSGQVFYHAEFGPQHVTG